MSEHDTGDGRAGRVAQPPGAPDGIERLWTPHRMAYVTRGDSSRTGAADATAVRSGVGESRSDESEYDVAAADSTPCPFCAIPAGSDADGLVVARGELVYAVLNLYPYNAGHLMVLPYRHVGDYTDASTAETAEMAAFTQHAVRTLQTVSAPAGFNIGMNQGAAGGAGIAAHLHQHIVPRWVGDANFMPVIGHTKVLPQLLSDTRALLADAW